jgi:aminobenzoyl-glutamate utilization protein B
MSVVGGEVIFSGVSRHGGSPSSGNALDAAELAIQSIERLRAHHFRDASVEHVIRVGGHIPNVTPDESRLWISTRHPEYERAREVYRFVVGVCAQASQLTGTGFREQLIAGSRGYLPNDALARVVYANLERVGPPKWSDADLGWLRELALACEPNGSFRLDRDLGLYSEGCDFYGQDDGEVSWRVPLARINWAVPREVPFHNWALTALSGHRCGHAGALMASEALALAAVDLYLAPDVLIVALDELRSRVGDEPLPRPEYGAFRTLTERPAQFWDATWIE